MDTIELSFVVSQTPIPDRVINLKIIVGYNSHLPIEAQSHITAAVNSFSAALSPASKHNVPANHAHRDLHSVPNFGK